MVDVVNDVIINYKSVGLDKVGSEIKQTSVSLDGLVVAATSADKATASLENRFKSLERQFGTTEGNAAKFADVQNKVNLAVAQNPALQERANDLLAAAKDRYLGAGEGVNKLEEAHSGLSGQAQALQHSLRSAIEQIALGVSPTQALSGQMGRLSYVASGQGGLAGAFSEVSGIAGGAISKIAGMVSPTVAAATALGGLSAVAIVAGVEWESAQTKVENALKGIGKQSGVTVSDINGIAESTANTTNLTIGSAREMATVFAATGKIGKENVSAATQAVDGLAGALGVDAASAAKTLAGALADPAKGLGELEALTGAYDLKTQELVKSLVRQGEAEQARSVLIKGVADATKDAADKNGIWAASFKLVKDGFDLVGGDLVKGFQLTRQDLGGAPASTGVSKQDQFGVAQGRLQSAQADMPALLSANAGDPQAIQAIYDSYAKLTDQVEKLKAAAREEALAPLTRSLKESAAAADNAVNSFVPQIQKIKETEDAIRALTKAQQDQAIAGTQANGGGDGAALVAAQNQLKTLQDSQTAAASYNQYVQQVAGSYKDVSTSAALQLSSLQDQKAIVEARTESEKLSAQYAKDYNDALRAGMSPADALAVASGKLALNEAAAAKAASSIADEARRAELAWQQAAIAASGLGNSLVAAGSVMTGGGAVGGGGGPGEVIGGDSGSYKSNSGTSKPDVMTQSGGFVASVDGVQYKAGGPHSQPIQPWSANDRPPQANPSAIAAQYIGRGDYSGAISAVEALKNVDTGQQMSLLGSLTQQKNTLTSNPAEQISNIQDLMTFIQHQPETLAGDQTLVSLQKSIDQLRQSTDQNTKTITDTFKPGQRTTVVNVAPGVTADQFIQSRTQIQRAVGAG